jgi:hypothetical protein
MSFMFDTTCCITGAAALRGAGGRGGELVGLRGGIGALAHGAGELRHRRGAALQVGRRLLGARAQVAVAVGHLGARHADRIGALADLRHHAAQAFDHGRLRPQHVAELVVAPIVRDAREHAVGDARGGVGDVRHVAQDAALHAPRQHEREAGGQQRQRAERQRHRLRAVAQRAVGILMALADRQVHALDRGGQLLVLGVGGLQRRHAGVGVDAAHVERHVGRLHEALRRLLDRLRGGAHRRVAGLRRRSR